MCDRDDAALRNFKSRAGQPKHGAELPKKQAYRETPDATTININLQFDSGWGNNMSDSDDMRMRFMHQGTSPANTHYASSNARRNGVNCMRSGFSS